MKTMLVTGGTGSFGKSLIKSYLQDKSQLNKIRKIIVYSRDEKKQQDMKLEFGNLPIQYIIGDIRDKHRLCKVFKEVDFIFHAAALKQVPVGEEFPEEVILTNVLGTQNIIEAAEKCGVEKVVNLSSDKAVMPVNAYGMTKGLSEKLVAAHEGDTICVSLRYGNVIGSRGSVIPLFISQLKEGKPVTMTDPNMTRFLLTLNEAVFLSKRCIEEGEQGDLFVIKSPACTVGTLAKAISMGIKKAYSEDIIGIRPGEKIHETLLTSEEVFKGEEKMAVDGIIYVKVSTKKKSGDYSLSLPFTSENTTRFNQQETLALLKRTGAL